MSEKTNTPGEKENLNDGTPKPSASAPASQSFNLGGKEATNVNPGDSENGRLRAEIARLTADLQREKVEHGRVKALSQSDSEKSRRIAELEREVEDLKADKMDFVDMLPQEMRDQVDPDQLKILGTLARKMSTRTADEFRRRDQDREAEQARMREAEQAKRVSEIGRMIEDRFPGFLRDTNPGGDKEDAWMRFLRDGRLNAVTDAYSTGNFPVLSSFITTFLTEAGVSPRREASGTAPLSPRPFSAGYDGGMQDTDQYSFDQYNAELEKAGDAVRSGQITGEQYRAVMDKLSKARDEGRVGGRVY